jgi:hypothetical protein
VNAGSDPGLIKLEHSAVRVRAVRVQAVRVQDGAGSGGGRAEQPKTGRLPG